LDAVVRWTSQGLQGVGSGKSGHGVLLDADPSVHGRDQGARPVELFLISLCGCTGMDVVSILGKMRVAFEQLEVRATGQREDEHPKRFTAIELNYRIWGSTIDEEKLVKAIELSLDRYCPVANTLKQAVELTYRYEVNPETATKNGGSL